MECMVRLFSLLWALATGELGALEESDGRPCTDPNG